MFSFHFDVGDSSNGPIGLCARVVAATRQAALQKVRNALPELVEIPTPDHPDVEYIHVYLNADAITVKHIDDRETVDNPP